MSDRSFDHSARPPRERVLVVTADPVLREAIVRLCAAGGASAQVLDEVTGIRQAWEVPPLVVVGADVAEQVVALGLPRRRGVVLVGLDLDDARVWDRAVLLGAESVVFLPDGESWLVDRFAEAVEGEPEGALVAILGGRGGAGATTFAVALAVTATRGRFRCMLVDGDPLGGGIDLALGGEDTEGLRWPQLSGACGRLSSEALAAAVPDFDGLSVLSCDRQGSEAIPLGAMQAVLAAGRRSNDLLVIDLPRRIDPATALVLAEADLTVLLVPAEVRATASAARIAALVLPLTRNLQVLVRGPAPGGLTGTSIASAIGLPLLGWLDAEPGLAQATDRGEPPARSAKGPLAEACGRVLSQLPVGARPAA